GMTKPNLVNVGEEYTLDGKTYRAKKLGILELFKFSTWIERRARESVGRATDLPDDVRDRMLSVVTQDIAAGVYAPGGEAFVKAATTPEGASYALYLGWHDDHPELTEE